MNARAASAPATSLAPTPGSHAAKTLGIVHTSFVLVDLLNQAARAHLPGVRVINVVDDSLIPYVLEHGVDEAIRRRMKNYLLAAAEAGTDVILSACSSVGEAVDAARAEVPVPILKIDEAMAEKAVMLGRRIGIFATAASTLAPTARLLHAKAALAGRKIETSEQYCSGGFDLLLAGKTDEHDRLVIDFVSAAASRFDVVLCAQASMSRLAPQIASRIDRPLLTSPDLAMRRLQQMLGT